MTLLSCNKTFTIWEKPCTQLVQFYLKIQIYIYRKLSLKKRIRINLERVYRDYMFESNAYKLQRERARQGQEPDYSKIKKL